MNEADEAARLRRHTLLFGWSAATFGLLVIALVATVCIVIHARYVRGLGG